MKILKKIFNNFLMIHNCDYEYYKNYYNLQNKKWKKNYNLKYNHFADDSTGLNYITYAFCWAASPQKHEFWNQLNKEWLKFLENLKNKKYLFK